MSDSNIAPATDSNSNQLNSNSSVDSTSPTNQNNTVASTPAPVPPLSPSSPSSPSNQVTSFLAPPASPDQEAGALSDNILPDIARQESALPEINRAESTLVSEFVASPSRLPPLPEGTPDRHSPTPPPHRHSPTPPPAQRHSPTPPQTEPVQATGTHQSNPSVASLVVSPDSPAHSLEGADTVPLPGSIASPAAAATEHTSAQHHREATQASRVNGFASSHTHNHTNSHSRSPSPSPVQTAPAPATHSVGNTTVTIHPFQPTAPARPTHTSHISSPPLPMSSSPSPSPPPQAPTVGADGKPLSRLQRMNSQAVIATDHAKEALKPSLTKALRYRDLTCPRIRDGKNGYRQYGIWKFTDTDFLKYGLGIMLYFRLVRRLCYFFLFIFFCSLPSLVFNFHGPDNIWVADKAIDGSYGLAKTTLANQGMALNVTIFGYSKKEIGLGLGAIDTLISVLFIAFTWWVFYSNKNASTNYNATVLTVRRFTICVTNLPRSNHIHTWHNPSI